MKVLHVSYNFHPVTGGVEKNIEDISKGLIKLGHTVDVCCNRSPETPKEEDYNGMHIFRYKAINARFYKISLKAAKLAKRYDIVHVHGIGFFSDYLGLTKFFHGKKLVLSTHGGIFHTSKLSLIKKTYFYLWSRFVLKFFDAVIAVSDSDRALFFRIKPNIEMIPNCIDFDRLSSVKRKPEKNVLIFIGRLSKNKRIDNLIKTIAEMKKRGHDATLVIIGQDWESQLEHLRSIASKAGIEKSVIFTGKISRENMMQYLRRAQFFVSASEYEGFGISVLEAMAAGVPVIVNNIEAFKTFVKNSQNGYIVDFTKTRQAAEEIIKIAKNKDLGDISNNAKMAAKQYDIKKTAKRFEETYQRVLATS